MGCLGNNLQESGGKPAHPFCHRDTLEGKKGLKFNIWIKSLLFVWNITSLLLVWGGPKLPVTPLHHRGQTSSKEGTKQRYSSYLGPPQSSPATFPTGTVWGATGSMVRVFCSTATRTSSDSCGKTWERGNQFQEGNTPQLPAAPAFPALTSCLVKSRQGPTSSR